MLAELEPHPHAAAVLGAALDPGQPPSHAYLLHGPAGAGKRTAARAFAAELLSRNAPDPANSRTRALHGTHPDLTWVAPSGAHEMLRRDVDDAVVAAAAHTPFESEYRVFVLERVDTMNDEAANSLLKTLEEPPGYVVLLLLTDRPSQVLPTIASRCQHVRFDAPPAPELAQRLQQQGADHEAAKAAAALSLGDGEKAQLLTSEVGMQLRAIAEAFARAPIHSQTTGRPWLALLEHARDQGRAAHHQLEQELAEELEYLPKKEHRRRETEYTERARRSERRAETAAVDHALQLAGLWYRDLLCVLAQAPELVHHTDRLQALIEDAQQQDPQTVNEALELVEDTRARLVLNVSYELAVEALAYRLERLLSRESAPR